LELALRVDNKETAVPSCTRTRSSSKATQMAWTGSARSALKDHTQDITAKAQHLSSRRRTFAADSDWKPPTDRLVYSPSSTSRARPQSKGVQLGRGPEPARRATLPPTHGRCSRNGTPRRGRCHPLGLQINRDETPRLGDSDRRPPPDLPVFPLHRLSSMTRLKETGLGRMEGPQGAQSSHGDRSCNRTPQPSAEAATFGHDKFDSDSTLWLNDSDWRLPPDQLACF
jgi:hypothetical protein